MTELNLGIFNMMGLKYSLYLVNKPAKFLNILGVSRTCMRDQDTDKRGTK